MKNRHRGRLIGPTRLGFAAASLWWPLRSCPAAAQPESPPDGVTIGDFWFRPSLELRVRGEYERHPVDTSTIELPLLGSTPAAAPGADQQWVVHERTRLGLSAERGVLFAALVLQDSRIAGLTSPARIDRFDPTPATGLHTAFIEVRAPDSRSTFVRVGRQEVAWGDGRLLGISDWSLTPRTLDAVRARLALPRFDIEGLAVLLSPPGAVPPQLASQAIAAGAVGSGAGAQLYGFAIAVHIDPLLHTEFAGLLRVARPPLPPSLTSSDTFVADARIFGDRAGFTYAAELAYEFGEFAVPGGVRRLAAWGVTGRVGWQTSWLFRPKFLLQASYATGGNRPGSGAAHRFDPILPDERAGLGQMGLYAWSNTADAAVLATVSPIEDLLSVTLGYRLVRLADPTDAWFSASLVPIGQNVGGAEALLGQEFDAAVTYAPFNALQLTAGYGAFFAAAGARAVLRASSSELGPRLLSAAFLQARLAAP
jgi:hypothetical protein